MYERHLMPGLLAALGDSPVVLVNGARQTGKSTLVRQLTERGHPARYLTLDDASLLAAARHDPTGFVAGLDGPVIIDEVQRAPDLFLAIKAEVDRDRRPGRFLLTGSADVLLLPRLADSLAGRMELHTLWPLSQGEIEGRSDALIDALFADRFPPGPLATTTRTEVLSRVLRGGYPEPLGRASANRRAAWFGSYVTTILQRDVRDLANIDGLTALPRLLALLATRVGGLLNHAELSRSTTLPQTTLKRYMALLQATFLVQELQPWSGNMGKRLVKSPKLLLADTGLAAYLLGMTAERAATDAVLVGPLLENFVAMELRKQQGWSRTRTSLFHFRTQAGQEVDLVLEDAAGRVVGIEVKASATVGAGDFRGLAALQEAAGERFYRGIVLYTGQTAVPYGERLGALPLASLWT